MPTARTSKIVILPCSVLLLYLSGLKNLAPTRTTEQRPCFAPEIKIMWEEQLVDPSDDYIESVDET